MKLTGTKQDRIRDLSNYLIFRIQILLMIVMILCSLMSQVTLFGICLILMAIITFTYRDVFKFFEIIAGIIIEWKYKDGNYRDSALSGSRFIQPDDWLARSLILDYFMIVIMGQSK